MKRKENLLIKLSTVILSKGQGSFKLKSPIQTFLEKNKPRQQCWGFLFRVNMEFFLFFIFKIISKSYETFSAILPFIFIASCKRMLLCAFRQY
jgi:hypothetical protein